MLVEHRTILSTAEERARLRAAVLRLGDLLGWQAHEVADFAGALCGRPFDDLGAPDLWRVVDEYGELAIAIAARVGRRGRKPRREPRGHQD